jgi:hypothetical protein
MLLGYIYTESWFSYNGRDETGGESLREYEKKRLIISNREQHGTLQLQVCNFSILSDAKKKKNLKVSGFHHFLAVGISPPVCRSIIFRQVFGSKRLLTSFQYLLT